MQTSHRWSQSIHVRAWPRQSFHQPYIHGSTAFRHLPRRNNIIDTSILHRSHLLRPSVISPTLLADMKRRFGHPARLNIKINLLKDKSSNPSQATSRDRTSKISIRHNNRHMEITLNRKSKLAHPRISPVLSKRWKTIHDPRNTGPTTPFTATQIQIPSHTPEQVADGIWKGSTTSPTGMFDGSTTSPTGMFDGTTNSPLTSVTHYTYSQTNNGNGPIVSTSSYVPANNATMLSISASASVSNGNTPLLPTSTARAPSKTDYQPMISTTANVPASSVLEQPSGTGRTRLSAKSSSLKPGNTNTKLANVNNHIKNTSSSSRVSHLALQASAHVSSNGVPNTSSTQVGTGAPTSGNSRNGNHSLASSIPSDADTPDAPDSQTPDSSDGPDVPETALTD